MKNSIKYIKFFSVITLFLFGSIFQYIPIFIFRLDPNNISVNTKVLLQLFSNFICVTILIILYRKSIIKGIKDLKNKNFKPLLKGFEIWFIGLMVMAFSNFIITWLNSGNTANNEESIRIMLKNSPYFASLSIVILAPIIEELTFRKSFREIFDNKWLYIATSGIIFGAIHIFLSPVNSIIDYLYIIPYCSMGVAFSYMYYETDNILVPITMHIMHNAITLISTLTMLGAIIW